MRRGPRVAVATRLSGCARRGGGEDCHRRDSREAVALPLNGAAPAGRRRPPSDSVRARPRRMSSECQVSIVGRPTSPSAAGCNCSSRSSHLDVVAARRRGSRSPPSPLRCPFVARATRPRGSTVGSPRVSSTLGHRSLRRRRDYGWGSPALDAKGGDRCSRLGPCRRSPARHPGRGVDCSRPSPSIAAPAFPGRGVDAWLTK